MYKSCCFQANMSKGILYLFILLPFWRHIYIHTPWTTENVLNETELYCLLALSAHCNLQTGFHHLLSHCAMLNNCLLYKVPALPIVHRYSTGQCTVHYRAVQCGGKNSSRVREMIDCPEYRYQPTARLQSFTFDIFRCFPFSIKWYCGIYSCYIFICP